MSGAGRVGAIYAVRSDRRAMSDERKRVAEARKKRSDDIRARKDAKVERVMRNFDFDGSGQLEKSELKAVMESLNDGMSVTEEEVEWLLTTCDGDKNAAIDKEEIYDAISWWEHYRSCKDRLSMIVRKYDTSGNGVLELDELVQVLTHLNDDRPVDRSEAQVVMKICDASRDGKLNPQELLYAISVWYAAHDQEVSKVELPHVPPPRPAVIQEYKKERREMRAQQKQAQGGGCCGGGCTIL
eukprot:TRINITY_DN2635_c0_g1_i1.p1 TRINITY_DN2635_c0_g1~~TRINITY_DN2635_c0_g1_i1.p1  ORF type:complete len:241 (+),score=64.13 TRINITY_DN2635_c0_g1_i1:69-791(+)